MEGYGFTAEIQQKIQGKFDQQLFDEANQWIGALTGKSCDEITCGTDFQIFLRDGVVLCELINVIAPGSVKKINTSSMAFKQMVCFYTT